MPNTSTKPYGVGGVGHHVKSTQFFQTFILNFSNKLFTFHCTTNPLYYHVFPATINIVGGPFLFPVEIRPRPVREPNICSVSTDCSGRIQRAERKREFNLQIQTQLKRHTDSPRQQNCNSVWITSFL